MTITDAINAFVADLPRQRGRNGRKSPKTARTYASALAGFAAQLAQDPATTDATALTCAHVIDFARNIADRHASATVNVYLTATVKFYRWLLRAKAAGFAPTDLTELEAGLQEDWRSASQSQKLRLPDEADVQAALTCAQAAQGDAQESQRLRLVALRNAALLQTLRATCARIGEVAALKRNDLDIGARCAQVTGKGRKVGTIFFDDRAIAAIVAYLSARDAALLRADGDEPLFARHDKPTGNRLLPVSANGLRLGLYRVCDAAGVDRFNPHSMRHRGATLIQKETHDLATTQRILRHESAATTAAFYVHLDDDDLRQALAGVEL
ncbi:MAG: hypothetical protein EHM35_00485 [Planctomycetaceae bacterium]|nr:MAG: hypothetical protein EHM35_00485 [Planctomycetaceae bacterium]